MKLFAAAVAGTAPHPSQPLLYYVQVLPAASHDEAVGIAMRDAETKLHGYTVLSPSVVEIPTGLPPYLEQELLPAIAQLLASYDRAISDERNSGIEIDQWFAGEAQSLLEKARSRLSRLLINDKEEEQHK